MLEIISLFTGHVSFQIFLFVYVQSNLTTLTGNNLLTDDILKKITLDVLVRCLVIVSDHRVKLAGHFQFSRTLSDNPLLFPALLLTSCPIHLFTSITIHPPCYQYAEELNYLR